ncbi:hypothetical protein DV738_g4397, partial [Chaetothyriales sp. CBS 135597]
MSTSLDRIEAAIIDGRARTPRYIQKQLQALYSALLRSLTPIQQAIAQETGYSSTEIWLETNQALEEVKEQFSKIKLDDFLEQEYRVASGRDRPTRRRPRGCIYIIPSFHTRLYSIIQPAAVAIASGSCVIIELSPDSSALDKVITEALTPVLDKDTFAIVNQRPEGDILSEEYTIVSGDQDIEVWNSSVGTSLKSPNTPTVAIVDRSADILEAARHIVRARFSFRGEDQLPAIQKINEPLLAIHPISSLDDAIDTAQATATASAHNSLLALYLFADPKAAKYLSQFISADLSLTNHVPPQLLVGPAAPLQYPVSISGRYTNEMFSSPCPELVVPTEKSRLWMRYLDGQISQQEADKVKAELAKPLGDIGEPEGKATGFFEQGFHLGLAVELLAVTGIFGLCAKYAISHLLLR